MVRQLTPYNSIMPVDVPHQRWIKTANVQNPGAGTCSRVVFRRRHVIANRKWPQQETLNYDWREIAWTVVVLRRHTASRFFARHTDGDVWYDDISVTEGVRGTTLISVSPAPFEMRGLKGQNAESVFSVQNVGGGTLNYTLRRSRWLDYCLRPVELRGSRCHRVFYDTADCRWGVIGEHHRG
jgi:hypothetical protein